MEISTQQIENIAEELDCGMKVYINIDSMKMIATLDRDENFYIDDELTDEEKEIESNPEKYIQIEKMDSRYSYKIMEQFKNSIDDIELKKKLELGLSLTKPFRNFKDIIDTEIEYRDKWFEFKKQKYIEYVKEQIEILTNSNRT